MYFEDDPLYPFVYGLSYTDFKYSNLRIISNSRSGILTDRQGEKVTVSVDIRNTGGMAGDEVVQMYVKECESQH